VHRLITALLTGLLAVPSTAVNAACIEFNTAVTQGALLWGQVVAGSRVYLDDEALAVSGAGIVVLGFGRDARGPAAVRVEGAQNCSLELQVASRDYNIQRVEGVPQKTVTPDPEDLERIRREAKLVREARANSSRDTDFSGGFQWPLAGPISGVYGSQRVYNGTPGRPHYGVDVAAPTGTPVAAPAAGVVVLAEPDLFYSGGTLIIDHGSEVNSSFLHLSKVLVKVGTRVQAGDLVAEVGATGRATGAQLDWRMNWRQRRVDPQLLVPPMPQSAYNTPP
jgi:murein DD-endopeptidase MepM/ murein hydrolase activator NlpD